MHSTTSSTIVSEASQVDQTLQRLGLSRELIEKAIRRGARDARSCTDFDPPTLSGQMRQGRTIRTLRELLVPRGWTKEFEGGLSLVQNTAKTIAIAVSSGDEFTGRHDATPHTKYPKGNSTLKAVTKNRQPSLFGDEEQTAEREFWILLVYSVGDSIVAELSRPRETVPAGAKKVKVVTWWERLIIGQVEVDEPITGEITADTGEHIAVEIRRK